MVPDKFNMVDMEGIDIITSQGEVVEGLYQKLLESIAQCRYQCLYNWKFDGILIPPTYVEMDIVDDVVWINEGVSVDEEDVVRVYSLEPPAPDPKLLALAVSANGDYLPPVDYDGFSSVNVAVPDPVFALLQATANGTYYPQQGVDGFSAVEVAVPAQQPILNTLSVTENGTYNPSVGVDGFSEVIVNVPQGSAGAYEYIAPDYFGNGYSYVSTGGDYYGGNSLGQILSIYQVPAGNYVVFCGNPVGNRFRAVGFYGKTSEDFMPVRETSMSQTLVFNGDINITGSSERSGDKLIQRLYFTLTQAGCVCVGTSNSGQSVESILLKINS